MDAFSQYLRYLRHCFKSHIPAQSFVRFVMDVFPFTAF